MAIKLLYHLFEIGETKAGKCHTYSGEFNQDSNLLTHYENLELLGYQLSDEESAYLDGTHKLYVKEG